jgi:PPOX class probable F420-dependent enzyme
MSLTEEKYVSFASFRRSGEAVTTTTWIVPLDDGRFGFWTSSASGKVKRIRNRAEVALTPCDSRGKVKDSGATIKATAVLVTSGPDFDTVRARVKAKYGLMVPISRFFNAVGHLGKGKFPYGNTVVLLTLVE